MCIKIQVSTHDVLCWDILYCLTFQLILTYFAFPKDVNLMFIGPCIILIVE